MNKIRKVLAVVVSITLSACISPYTLEEVDAVEGLLVVNGTITDGVSEFRLSTSYSPLDVVTEDIYINNANLVVECDNGTVFDQVKTLEKGTYQISTPQLLMDQKYRIKVSYNGSTFYSEYLSPLQTPAISDVYWEKQDMGEPVNIFMTSKNTGEQSPYYQWIYNEIWEYSTELYSEYHPYYCWSYVRSSGLQIGTSEKTNNNIVALVKEIPASSDKLSIMYQIKVQMFSIRKEAYEYFNNLNKNIEDSGGIFSPIPSEMNGNITCAEDNSIRVIGYVDVATSQRKEIYISGKENLYEPPVRECSKQVIREVLFPFYPTYLLYYEDFGEKKFAPPRCVNCTRYNNGTTIKPENWPTDSHNNK